VKWSKICKAKRKGGLGIKNLRKLNVSLLCKWWWVLESEGIWQQLVRLKNVKNSPICLIKHKQSDSPVWTNLPEVRHIYLSGRDFVVNNGESISFWLDRWTGDKPLCLEFPVLYYLALNQGCTVREIAERGWVVPFSINLPTIIRQQWYMLAAYLSSIQLNNEKDKPIWKWTKSKKFSVKSVYEHLTKMKMVLHTRLFGRQKILRK
jgi:hypothetical protein